MKQLIKLLVILLAVSISSVLAQTPETYTLVRVSNFDGTTVIQSLTASQLAELRKDVALENKLIKEAYQSVAQEWRKSHKGRTVKQTIRTKEMSREVEVPAPIPPFPLRNPKPRVISQIGTFQSAEAAAERKQALEAAVKPAAVPDKAAEADKAKVAVPSSKKGKGEEVDMESLFASLMSELARLKGEAASPSKGGKK
ncbi:MAG: hypothetical protein A2283_17040 [Lentisphaerae bacterium RIFOXYA12_FULL_48_11]|nr:MAG: hypothetical protein A2283_17040 [Lentisphaerae bacterium RIFOXYA12_FULL_48_11]